MADFETALRRARQLSDTFGMHPSVRNDKVVVTEGDSEAYYHVSPLGEGETLTMTPEAFAQWQTEHEGNNWT